MSTLEEIKAVKSEIEETSARDRGYFREVINHIDGEMWLETIYSLACEGVLTPSLSGTSNLIFENIILTEIVRNMNLEEFKEIAKYFYLN